VTAVTPKIAMNLRYAIEHVSWIDDITAELITVARIGPHDPDHFWQSHTNDRIQRHNG
jgi:hypothetical protein